MGRGGESVWLVKKAFDCARIAVQFDQACNVDQAVLYYEKVAACSCIALYCIVLYCIVLYCIVLYCVVLCYLCV